jgi:hypothetical protein
MGNAFSTLKEEMQKTAQHHLDLSSTLRKEIETPLADFIDYQSTTRRMVRIFFKKKTFS